MGVAPAPFALLFQQLQHILPSTMPQHKSLSTMPQFRHISPSTTLLPLFLHQFQSNVRATAKPKPIAIVRSHLNPPAESANFDYAFETANGIKQEATGTVRNVDDVDVTVMTGSYEFIGADGVVYAVEWYADESGFHATAPHLPR